MDVLTKIWTVFTSIWEYLDGHKTDLGVKLLGWVSAATLLLGYFPIHPVFLDQFISFFQTVGMYLTGGGLIHKMAKAGINGSSALPALLTPLPTAPPTVPPK